MSAKRSFDIKTKAPQPAPRKAVGKKVKSKPAPRVRKPSLRERREQQEQVKNILIGIVALGIVGGLLYLLWLPDARISQVRAEGTPHEEAIEAMALQKMEGAYFLVFPRDSFFFYPEKQIEQEILSMYPSVSSASVSRAGLTALSVKLSSRDKAFLWCGTPETAGPEGSSCYEADETGFVFSPASFEQGTTSALVVYARLTAATGTDSYPLRAHVEGAERIDDILRFSRSIEALGIPLRSIAIRNDEADVYTEGGTRITYVVGKEREATESAEAALPSLNLMDGSVEYVDLRFPGKAYLKRTAEVEVSEE